MPLLRDPRPSTSSDGHSVISSLSLGTKRRFPLLHRKKNRNSELSSSPLVPGSKKTGFRVHVQVKFEKPLVNCDHARDYDGSPKFVASDRICQALLSRLQHCSAELITRHDCNALDPLHKPHRDVKPLRYRITYRVERDGLVLVEKSLRSFQEYDLTLDDAREVVSATDRIVGLFLLRHDPGFRWAEVTEPESFSAEAETVRPCTGRPQTTLCIPRSRFVNASQKFEMIPGFSIELYLRSRCATRYPENRNASIKIDSLQPTPLTLLTGEDLTTRVCNLLDDPVMACKRKFDKRHRSCDGLEGSGGCQHIEDGAVDIMIKVRNNLGPDYNYFSHRVQTSKVLFNDPQGRDFDEFTNQLKAKMEKARDMSDHTIRSMDDLIVRIRELRGKNWSVHEPLAFRLDSSVTYCRQTIDAVIERLQSGISNVLEGYEDALATMTVHKRGHLIYDGFLDGAGAPDGIPMEKYETPDHERRSLEQRLRERIRADITMLCKDTCALDCSDILPNLKIRGGDSRSSFSSSMARPTSQLSNTESITSARSDHTLSKKQAKPNLRATSQTSLPMPDLQRVPSGLETAKRHGYMADYIADDENLSEPPSTPSLVDTDSISPRDSVVVTPMSSRHVHEDQSNQGLRIIDDGHRIIYQQHSDADAIAHGGTEIHHFVEEDDEGAHLSKGQPIDTPSKKPDRRSFDTRMPDLSGLAETTPVSTEPKTKEEKPLSAPETEENKPVEEAIVTQETVAPETVVPKVLASEEVSSQGDIKSAEEEATPKQEKQVLGLVTPEPDAAKEELQKELPAEGVLEYVCQPASPIESEGAPTVKQTQQAQLSEAVEVATVEERENVTQETPAIRLESVEPQQESKEALTTSEQFEAFQDDTWELVEASNVLNPVHHALSLVPEEVEPNTKSETRMESDSTQPATQAILEPKEDLDSQSKQVAEESNEEEVALGDFPKPPSSEKSLTEEPKFRPSEDSAIDLKERHIAEEQRGRHTASNSDDSGIVLDEQKVPVLDIKTPAMPAPESTEVVDKVAEDKPAESVDVLPPVTEEPSIIIPDVIPRSTLTDLEIPEVIPRPRRSTLSGRPKSMALDLNMEYDPFEGQGEYSPIEARPMSLTGLTRPGFHRRQPSAGWFGLHEQPHPSFGLRNALVPYRFQNMRFEQTSANSCMPSTSSNDDGL